MLHDNDALALRGAVGILDLDTLEYVTSEVWAVAHDLDAPSTVEPTPIDEVRTAWSFKVVHHAYGALGRIESWPSVARNASKSER